MDKGIGFLLGTIGPILLFLIVFFLAGILWAVVAEGIVLVIVTLLKRM